MTDIIGEIEGAVANFLHSTDAAVSEASSEISADAAAIVSDVGAAPEVVSADIDALVSHVEASAGIVSDAASAVVDTVAQVNLILLYGVKTVPVDNGLSMALIADIDDGSGRRAVQKTISLPIEAHLLGSELAGLLGS